MMEKIKRPAICIPLTGETKQALIDEAEWALRQPCELLEFRADYMYGHIAADSEKLPQESYKELAETLREIKCLAGSRSVIFTMRTVEEGGEADISPNAYCDINMRIIEEGIADIIDLQLQRYEGSLMDKAGTAGTLIYKAHEAGMKVILSKHDFASTPGLEEIVMVLCRMQELEADIPKIAVMPQSEEDVHILLEASRIMKENYARGSFIALSMGELGQISRICGGTFGSAITFAAGKRQSAPGQIDARTLKACICDYYEDKV